MLPVKANFSPKAAEITKLQIQNCEMFYDGKKVETCSPRNGLMKFMYFLRSLDKPCILIAHNGLRFDAPRIIKLAESLQLLKEFKVFVKGFCDSVLVFKSLLPNRCKAKASFKQGDLVSELLEKEDNLDAHNALGDVLMLQKLIIKLGVSSDSIIQKTQSIHYILNAKTRNSKLDSCKQSLSNLSISNFMKRKIANAAIDLSILKEAFKTGDLKGLTILLGENVNGKPRVTNSKAIIKNIYDQIKLL